jgi:hypothetical protein
MSNIASINYIMQPNPETFGGNEYGDVAGDKGSDERDNLMGSDDERKGGLEDSVQLGTRTGQSQVVTWSLPTIPVKPDFRKSERRLDETCNAALPQQHPLPVKAMSTV